MAVDTAEKRYSMIEFGDGSMGVMFEPDGSVDLDDRQHLLACYSGIAFGQTVVSPDLCWPLTVSVTSKTTTATLSSNGTTTMEKGC